MIYTEGSDNGAHVLVSYASQSCIDLLYTINWSVGGCCLSSVKAMRRPDERININSSPRSFFIVPCLGEGKANYQKKYYDGKECYVCDSDGRSHRSGSGKGFC